MATYPKEFTTHCCFNCEYHLDFRFNGPGNLKDTLLCELDFEGGIDYKDASKRKQCDKPACSNYKLHRGCEKYMHFNKPQVYVRLELF